MKEEVAYSWGECNFRSAGQGSGEMTAIIHVCINNGSPLLWFRMLPGGLEWMDSLSGVLELMDAQCQLLATPISNTLYRLKNWRLYEAHQQNVNRSGSHTQSSQTLRLTSLVLWSNSRCSQASLELSKVLSGSARAFSGAPECTCSYGGAFRMLQDWTCRRVKCCCSWDLCAGLQETSTAAYIPAQLCRRLSAVISQQWLLGFHNHEAFRVSDSPLLQSQDSLHHNMACIIYLSLSLYIHTANPAADGTGA